MKIARLAGLAVMAVMAVGLMTASSAFAGAELNPETGATFPILILALGGLSLLRSPGASVDIHCKKFLFHGLILSRTLLSGVFVHFLECAYINTATKVACEANSLTSQAGLIITNTLRALIGLVLPNRAAGILFEPETGAQFVNLAANATTGCEIPETKITGSVGGEITPTGKQLKNSKVTLTANAAGTGNIVSDIDVPVFGLVQPKLVGYSVSSSFAAEGETSTTPTIEVT